MGLFSRFFKPKQTAQAEERIIAVLSLDNETYEVVKLDFDIAQDVYTKSYPDGNVFGGKIRCTIRGALGNRIIAWGVHVYRRESGEIRFYPDSRRLDKGSDFSIRFENANCLRLARTVVTGKEQLTELLIAPHLVKVGGDEFENKWKGDKIYG